MAARKKSLFKAPAMAIVIVAGVLMSAAASAQSLREIRARESEESALDREAAYTQSVCGRSLSVTIDWRSAADWPESVSLVASCDGALGALEAFCRNRDGKAKAQRVTRFVCAGDGSGASLRGSELRYGASPGDNGFSATKALLDSEL